MRILAPVALACLLSSATPAQDNVLLIIADDVGRENVTVYGVDPDAARTPNIDALAREGVLFRRAYSSPVCSPTRATILTGRHAWRTGLGAALFGPSAEELILSAPTIADVVSEAGYRTAAAGKWHLGAANLLHPMSAGFEQHLGSPANLSDYSSWAKSVNGLLTASSTYATTDTVDDAISLIGQFGDEPWFLWVAFNAAHAPFHAPPAALHGYALPPMVTGNEPVHTKAMIEAMDTEIGRLLDNVDLGETVVIFVGDNGPDSLSVLPPWDPTHGKHSVYDLGIHVPLIIAGSGTVKGAACDALVNTTDLYATIAQFADAPPEAGLDSISLLPFLSDPEAPSFRDHAYSERFKPNFDPADGWPGVFQIRMQSAIGDKYKLNYTYVPQSAQVDPDKRELFDLTTDPFETTNLLAEPLTPEAQDAYTDLRVFLVSQGPSPWSKLGASLPGTQGAPELSGFGPLVPGTTARLKLKYDMPGAEGTLVVGFSQVDTPLYCGILVPDPQILKPIQVGSSGSFTLIFPWPELAGGTEVFMQAWLQDPGGPCGYAASNALMGTSAP